MHFSQFCSFRLEYVETEKTHMKTSMQQISEMRTNKQTTADEEGRNWCDHDG
jgi:hypothetical protein